MILGVDPSLTCTAICDAVGITLVRSKLTGMERIDDISSTVWNLSHPGDVVIIEGYSYASKNQAHQCGELGGVIRMDLWRAKIRYIDVAPGVLKKYATGNGGANKAMVLSAAVKRSGLEFATDDAADAWWLYAIGCELQGNPVCEMPAAQRAAIAKLREVCAA